MLLSYKRDGRGLMMPNESLISQELSSDGAPHWWNGEARVPEATQTNQFCLHFHPGYHLVAKHARLQHPDFCQEDNNVDLHMHFPGWSPMTD